MVNRNQCNDRTVRWRIIRALVVAAALLLNAPAIAWAEVHVVNEAGADAAMVADVEKTTAVFQQVLQNDMNLQLTRDVQVFVCPTRENYAQVLQREFKMAQDKAAREAKLTGGMSNDRRQIVALNGGSGAMRSAQDRASSMGHELFHQMQAQLSNNNNSKAMKWLSEGSADLIGARTSERSGYQSLDKWKVDRINTLRNAPLHATAAELVHSSLDKMAAMLEEKKYPYQMSDLMVFYLLSQQPGSRGYQGISDYFRLVGTLGDGDRAFEQAFGLTINQFLADFEVWFAKTTTQAAQVEVIRQDGVSPAAAADVERSVLLTRKLFREKWNEDIQSSERIVLTANKAAYGAALSREFGFSAAVAEQRAKSSYWYWMGSTTVLDIGTLATPEQRIYATANTLVKRYQAQAASNQQALAALSWLTNGSTYLVGSAVVDAAGVSSLETYRSSWLATLRKAAQLPQLTELQTPQQWSGAVKQYGGGLTSALANTATLHLLESYGWGSLNRWFHALKETNNAEAAFAKTYGISAAQYSADFAAFLQNELTKP